MATDHTSFAAEGAVFGGPTGGTDIRSAYTPAAPGIYGGLTGVYEFSGGSAFGDQGQVVAPVAGEYGVVAGSLTYVYPFKPFGGTLSSSLQQSYVDGNISVGPKGSYSSGLGDTYVEFLAYSRYIGPLFGDNSQIPVSGTPRLPYGLTLRASYSMIFATGVYSPKLIVPPGHNDFFFIPNFAATYLTSPNVIGDGIELSSRVFLDFAARNTETDYFTGLVVNTDFAVSNRLGLFQFGLAGFYAQQVTRDSRGGEVVAPNGKRLISFDLGPVLAYDIPKWNASIKAKFYVPVETRNTINIDRFIIGYGMKF